MSLDRTHRFRFPRSAPLLVALLTAGCTDGNGGGGTDVEDNPVPTMSSLSQTEALAGTESLTLTVRGTGFVEASQVLVDGVAGSSTFVDATALDLRLSTGELAQAGTLGISVRNPPPGGGTSGSLELDVLNPSPTLSSLGQTTTFAGIDSLLLSVTGSGFVEQSEVLVDGEPRSATFAASTSLQVVLPGSDFSSARTLWVSVRNPSPGGGTSGSLPLDVVHPSPSITVLPSQGATAGGPGFTLYIHGTGFVSSTVALWNGEPRTTQAVGSNRLLVTIPSSDVASPAAVTIGVETPPPGGGTASASFEVRTVAAATATSVQRLGLVGRHLVSDRARNLLYVSSPSDAPEHANSVVRVDPASASVTGSTFVGSAPGRLAISDDASVLYAGLDGASAVRRVQLDTFEPGLQWALPASQTAGDLEVQPGNPQTAIVSRHRPGYSPPLQGVTVYDDGVPRPMSSRGHTGGNRITVLGAPDVVYGFNNAHTGFEFFTIAITEEGASHVQETRSLMTGFYTDIVGDAGRVYGSDGSMVDAEQHQRIAGLQAGHAVRPDPETGRVYILDDTGIDVFDMNTFTLLGTIPVSGHSFDHPANAIKALVRWGDDGLAFLDLDELIIVRSPIVSGS